MNGKLQKCDINVYNFFSDLGFISNVCNVSLQFCLKWCHIFYTDSMFVVLVNEVVPQLHIVMWPT